MKICVVGFGHFAGVVSHCLAAEGHRVTASDFGPPLFREDQKLPKDEPGWELNYVLAIDSCPEDADLFWIAYDVPLDASGAPVVDEILARIQRLDAAVPKAIPFLVSCQWPVGATRKIASLCEGREFVYVMENVRAGKAIADFQANPIPAIGWPKYHEQLALQLAQIGGGQSTRMMSWESAEFGKHAMNAFIALQIAFVNELGWLGSAFGADPADITRVLLSDARVSPNAPLKIGQPFGGGSLKRDLLVLNHLAEHLARPVPILRAILPSNEA